MARFKGMTGLSSAKIRIGTRASPLALAQAELVRQALLTDDTALSPDAVVLVPMVTAGDVETVKNLAQWGFKGLFTKELQEALLTRRIDCAVHSMKDVPSTPPDELHIAGMLKRADARDAFISHARIPFDALPQGTTIGTSSVRRAAQIRYVRPDITIVPLRGNVQTRLKKLEQNIAEATFLATAGLIRLGLESCIGEIMDTTRMLPAIAQGAIGIECLQSHADLTERITRISDNDTMQTVSAERVLLQLLDGNCRTPLAGYCVVEGHYVHLDAMIIAPDGSDAVRQEIRGPYQDALHLASELAAYLKERGGAYLVS